MYTKRFALAYVFLGMAVMCALTILACVWLVRGKEHVVYAQSGPVAITNKSSGADVERHFADGKEYSQFPATAVQMRDGTCYAYTNKVSWLAMECFGAVKR